MSESMADEDAFAFVLIQPWDSPLCYDAPDANSSLVGNLSSLLLGNASFNASSSVKAQADSGSDIASFDEYYMEAANVAVCLFNTLANGLSLVVFLNKAFNRSAVCLLLIGLSVFETVFQLCQGGYLAYNLMRACLPVPIPSRRLAHWLAGLAVLSRQASVAFQLARNWALAGLSYHRYEAVCRATGRQLLTKSRCLPLLLACAALCALLSLPRLFEAQEVVCQQQPEAQLAVAAHSGQQYMQDRYVLSMTMPYPPLFYNRVYQLFYLSACLFLLQSGGPSLVVFVCSALVLKVLWKRQRFRESRNMRRRAATDKLIIALALTFFVLEMPAFLSKLLFASRALPREAEVLLSKWCNFLITIDSSMNIFIYLFSNPTFLLVTKQLLCRSRPAVSLHSRRLSAEETISVSKRVASHRQTTKL